MALDAQSRALLAVIDISEPVQTLTPDQARAASRARRAAAGPPPPRPLPHVEDRLIPGPGGPLPLRVYRPGTTDRPVLLFLHGGGWVLGDLESHDGYCRDLAAESGCAVVAVDYRLAPEHPFPAALEDAQAALAWLATHGTEAGLDTRRLAIGGDSSGANLAAATAQWARDHGGPPICRQVLVYPVTDHEESDSYRRHAEGAYLTAEAMRWYWRQYLGGADGRHPRASPLRAASLRDLPPTLVIVAEHDPLHDEGVAYAERLRADGVDTMLVDMPGVFHGFASMGSTLDKASQALHIAARFLASPADPRTP
jgi:acetyl esterase